MLSTIKPFSWSTVFRFHRKMEWVANYYSLFFLSNNPRKLGQSLLLDLKRIGQRLNEIHKRNLLIKQHRNFFRRASLIDLFKKYIVTKSKILEQFPSFSSEMYITISNSRIYPCWELKHSYFLIVLCDALMSHGLRCLFIFYVRFS